MAVRTHPCVTCGKTEGPMCFSNDATCSDLCEKRRPPQVSLDQIQIHARHLSADEVRGLYGDGRPTTVTQGRWRP